MRDRVETLGAALLIGAGLVLLTRSQQLLGVNWGNPLPRRVVFSGWGRPREYRDGIHYGIDIGAPIGEPVYAVADGVVEHIDTIADSFAGKHVVIRHVAAPGTDGTGGGRLWSRYLHLSAIAAALRVGAPIARGARVGEVGTTGTTTGNPHLHFDVEVDKALVPGYKARFGSPTPAIEGAMGPWGLYVPAEALIPVSGYDAAARSWARAHKVVIR